MQQQGEKPPGPTGAIRGFLRWSMTPPQSYPMYVLCLFLVLGLSYFTGTLKPRKTVSGPQTTAVPRN